MQTFEAWWVGEKGRPPLPEEREAFDLAHKAFNYVAEQNAYRIQREQDLRKGAERQADRLRALWFEAEARALQPPKRLSLGAPEPVGRLRVVVPTEADVVVDEKHALKKGERAEFLSSYDENGLPRWERV